MSIKQVREITIHEMAGKPPGGYATWEAFAESIPPYAVVDTDLLYQGDSDPFHVTLDVFKIGAVSGNGLLYDDDLVSALEAQLPGKGGIQGHTPPGTEGYLYPVDEIDWIGHVRIGDTTYAKAYIPPGKTREMVRRTKARGGLLRTSFEGAGIPEDVDAKQGIWRLREFELDRLDLAPANKAALRRSQSGNPVLTRQMYTPDTEENLMSDETKTIVLADVPQDVREQIVAEAKLKVDAGRVTELETKLAEAEAQVAEMRTNTELVGEIRALIAQDNGADVMGVIRQMQATLSNLAETLGVDVALVETRVSELHENVQQMAAREFSARVDSVVSEFTNWNTKTDAQAAQVLALRNMFSKAVAARLDGSQDEPAVREIAQAVWDDEYKPLAEAVRMAIVGPVALAGSKPGAGPDPEAVRKAWNIPAPGKK